MAQTKHAVAKQKQVKANFIEDTKAELRKVVWPTKEAVVNASIVILIIVFFTTLFISGVDLGLSKVANIWLKIG